MENVLITEVLTSVRPGFLIRNNIKDENTGDH
jgi:hypothetical protein